MSKLTEAAKKFIKFWMGAFRDPVTLDASSSRLIAWGCAIVAWFISIWTAVHGQVTATIVALVTALVAQGAVALINRTTKE